MSTHTKVGWYQECTDHPEPDMPDGPYSADDPAWRAHDDWDDAHVRVGDDGILTCEANRIGDACAECSETRVERTEDSMAYVPWHGTATPRAADGRFAPAASASP